MQSTPIQSDEPNDKLAAIPYEDLHQQAIEYISESNDLIFQKLPKIVSQLIQQEVWKNRGHAYKNFGEYALSPAPQGLGISNNDMLWLLKSAMNKTAVNGAHWAEVLWEVDSSVRTYAKQKNIPISHLNSNLEVAGLMSQESDQEQIITYVPSRSNSNDGRLLKLRKKDPEAYDSVIEGKVMLKDAWPQTPRKKLHPVESAKNKFASLSKSDREAFLAWIEEEKENLL